MRRLVIGVIAACALVSCAQPQAGTPPENTEAATAPVGNERGALVSSTEIGHTDLAVRLLGATATHVLYRSTSGDGASGTQVSGTVFTPKGAPPAGGWPIVGVGHGTTGVTDECAPSLYPNLLGTIGIVAPFLERGMVVAVTDYEGLGTQGAHPYLDPDAAAYNVVDAVRAARNVVPEAGNRWGAIGNSQGGQAVWSAAEHREYGDGLELVGSAALSPTADLTPLFGLGAPRTLPQMLLTPFLVEGLRFGHPGVDDAQYFRGALETDKRALTACTDLLGVQKAEAATRLVPGDASPDTETSRAAMVDWLASIALPKSPTSTPMLVAVGADDQLIDPKWTQDAVTRACSMGDVVEFRVLAGQGHSDTRATGDGVRWLADRFAGVPAVDTCPKG